MTTISNKYRRAIIRNMTGPAPYAGGAQPHIVQKKDDETPVEFRMRVASFVCGLKMTPGVNRDLFEVRYEC